MPGHSAGRGRHIEAMRVHSGGTRVARWPLARAVWCVLFCGSGGSCAAPGIFGNASWGVGLVESSGGSAGTGTPVTSAGGRSGGVEAIVGLLFGEIMMASVREKSDLR